jgi:hypothetical protein
MRRQADGASTCSAAFCAERDRFLLLGKQVGEFDDAATRSSSAARRSGAERPVGERRQLGDL